jgi:simple sugar transport system permease protein
VALLGQGAAVGIVLAGILWGALYAGGLVMQTDVNISSHIVEILEAVVLFTLAANFLRTIKLRFPTPGRTLQGPTSIEAEQTAFEVEASASPGSSPSSAG